MARMCKLTDAHWKRIGVPIGIEGSGVGSGNLVLRRMRVRRIGGSSSEDESILAMLWADWSDSSGWAFNSPLAERHANPQKPTSQPKPSSPLKQVRRRKREVARRFQWSILEVWQAIGLMGSSSWSWAVVKLMGSNRWVQSNCRSQRAFQGQWRG